MDTEVFQYKISAVLLCNADSVRIRETSKEQSRQNFAYEKSCRGSVYFEKKSEVFERALSVFDNDVIVVCLRCESD